MAFFAFSTLLLASLAYSSPEVEVPGQKVTYRGTVSNSIEHFQGIRYAESTSGERRFAPPQSYAPEHNTVVDATQAGALCPQTKDAFPLLFDATPDLSEDCLNLRIDRPAGVAAGEKLPVVLWLHGGGVVKGSAYDSHFNPDKLLQRSVEDGTPVIYASINYRMLIFGFPRLPLLKDQKSLNLGLRDQRMGFQWIRDNIEAFGGDPDRITVYGLSAGGTFAGLHTMAYGGEKGLPFQQAWAMSGPPGTAVNMTSDVTTYHTENVADRLDCGGKTSDEETLKCLRAVPMDDLLDAALTYSRENHPPAGLFTFIPSIDDDFIPDTQSHLVKAGRFVKGVRMIFGWTSEDGAMNVGDAKAVQSEEDMIQPIKNFASELSTEQIEGLFALYPASAFQEELDNYEARKGDSGPDISVHFFRAARVLRDLQFTCDSVQFGYEVFKQSKQTQASFDNVRLYQLNQSAFAPMMAASGMPHIQVIHGSDTPYIFDDFPEAGLSGADQDLATWFVRSLIQFAYTGSPSPSGSSSEQSPVWPAAYTSLASGEDESGLPDFNIQVVGGPYGTGPASAREGSVESSYKYKAQVAMDGVMDFAGMRSPEAATRHRLIEEDDLHRRCAYIRSLDDTLGR